MTVQEGVCAIMMGVAQAENTAKKELSEGMAAARENQLKAILPGIIDGSNEKTDIEVQADAAEGALMFLKASL